MLRSFIHAMFSFCYVESPLCSAITAAGNINRLSHRYADIDLPQSITLNWSQFTCVDFPKAMTSGVPMFQLAAAK